LVARVAACTPLRYQAGAHLALDRPAHVRAASGAAFIAGRLAVIQDDANFIAFIDLATGVVDSIALPAGIDEKRQFDDERGNKRFKLDLEACVAVPGKLGPRFVAFGSGSSSAREQVVLVDGIAAGAPDLTVVHAHRFYESIRHERAFAGSDLNIEGAVFRDGQLTLFGRGNGAPADDRLPLNATCVFDWAALERHLGAPNVSAPPTPRHITQYDLGSIDGIPLGFTDAVVWGEEVLFAAAAEDSPDARRDGRVAGSVLGLITVDGHVRQCPIAYVGGTPYRAKVEGLAVTDDQPPQLYALIDQDDPSAPSELCVIELSGDWPAA
jgi:hypothetical protein